MGKDSQMREENKISLLIFYSQIVLAVPVWAENAIENFDCLFQ